MKYNKTQVINFRVSEEKKQEILKLAYENNLTITDLLIMSFDYYKHLDISLKEYE